MSQNRDSLKLLYGRDQLYGFKTKGSFTYLQKLALNANIDIGSAHTADSILDIVSQFPIFIEDFFFNTLFQGKRMTKYGATNGSFVFGNSGSWNGPIVFAYKYELKVLQDLACAYLALTGTVELGEKRHLTRDLLRAKSCSSMLGNLGYCASGDYLSRRLPCEVSRLHDVNTSDYLSSVAGYMLHKQSCRTPGYYLLSQQAGAITGSTVQKS